MDYTKHPKFNAIVTNNTVLGQKQIKHNYFVEFILEVHHATH